MTDYTEIEKLALEEVNKHAKIYEEAALFNTAKVMNRPPVTLTATLGAKI